MHIVTVVGDSQVGKTALCEQWATPLSVTDSYMATMSVNHYVLSTMTIHDTPSQSRFQMKLEPYYASSDVIVLVANEDSDSDRWYARIRPVAPSASWLLLWTGDGPCPYKRAWASGLNIPCIHTSLASVEQVDNAFKHLVRVVRRHAPRPERVPLAGYPLLDEARRWLTCV